MYLSIFFSLKHFPHCTLRTHISLKLFDENQQKTIDKLAINQVTQCESETQNIESRTIVAAIYSKARATNLLGCFTQQSFQKRKYIAHTSQMEINTDSITNPFTKTT